MVFSYKLFFLPIIVKLSKKNSQKILEIDLENIPNCKIFFSRNKVSLQTLKYKKKNNSNCALLRCKKKQVVM